MEKLDYYALIIVFFQEFIMFKGKMLSSKFEYDGNFMSPPVQVFFCFYMEEEDFYR